jgi:hypothetical protein
LHTPPACERSTRSSGRIDERRGAVTFDDEDDTVHCEIVDEHASDRTTERCRGSARR